MNLSIESIVDGLLEGDISSRDATSLIIKMVAAHDAYRKNARRDAAMFAMQGLCARGNIAGTPQERASVAIEIADALLAELAKEPK